MMNLKKIGAAALAAAMAAVSVGCGSGTAYPLTIDGVKVKAGIYIYYSYAAYSEAISTISEQNAELDTTDDELVKKQFIDNVDAATWIQNKTEEYCEQFVAIQKDFEAKGLSLTAEEKNSVEEYVSASWETNGEVFERNGISEASVKDVLTSTYKADTLFLHYYGIDGENGVTEEDLHEYYVENNARVRYIQFDLTDGNGDLLKEDGKKEMEEMVSTYLEALEALEGDEEAISAEMDTIQEEYNAYVTSISEEAAAATATSATDADGNEIPATTTTTTTTTTTAETTTTTTVAVEEDAALTGAETTVPNSRSTTTVAEGETTAAEETAETTTTTTAPYASESIIAKITTEEDAEESEITYTPSKKAYEAIFNDAEYGVPMMVKDEDAYYLIVRFDIEDRMTEDDLWTEDNKQLVITNKYSDAFDEDLDKMCEALNVEKNDRAIKRYDAFEIDFSAK